MSIDRPHIECKFHNDPRLFVGVATIVAHAAAHAGLRRREQDELAEATLKACEKGLCRCSASSEGSVVRMGVSSFSDRVEVNLEFPDDGSRPKNSPFDAKSGRPNVKLVQYREAEKSKPAL
jgi:hypothetical protein